MNEWERCVAAQAITELIARYNRAVDDRRGLDIPAMFTPDGSLETMGKTVTGRDALAEMFTAAGNPLDRPLTAHHVTNIVIEFEEDSATAASDFLVVRRTAAGVESLLVGRYDDRLRREDGVWRFVHRKTVPMARTDI